eukprot:2523887-Prymnesium_polylepis.2
MVMANRVARATCGTARKICLGHFGMRRTDRMMARCHPRARTAARTQKRRTHAGVHRMTKK